MRERVELLLGHATRGDVGDDLPLGLRADPARRGAAARLHAPVHDLRPGRLAAAGQALPRRARRRPQALHAGARSSNQISDAKNQLRDADAYRADRRRATSSRWSPTSTSSTSASCMRMNAMDFDDLLFRTVNLLELFPEVRERYRAPFRHVLVDEYQDTNHAQYRLLQLLAGRAPQPGGGRRRRAVDLQLPRRRHPQHPRLPGRLPRRARRQARAELPLDADDPRRRQRGDRQQPRRRSPSTCGPTRARATRSSVRELDDEHAEARYVRRRDRAARRRGRVARGDRGLLPHQRAVAGARGHARARRDRLPGDRRHEVLRARRDQGRDRLPDAAGQPARRRSRFTRDRQLAAARDRPDVAVARHRARRARWAITIWEAAADAARRARARRRGGQGARALHGRRWRSCASARRRASRSATCSRRVLHETGYLDALEAERTIEAQGRIENLEELVEVAREFDGTRGAERGPLDVFLQQIALVLATPTRAATTRAW